ncbi:MAG: DNA-processing protein DprA [Phormidesmis sp.]
MATERAYWLAWSQIKGVGPVTIKHLWEHFGALALAWQASAAELLPVDGIGLLSAEKIVAQRPKLNPEKMLAQHEKENLSFWTPADPDYPALLFAINDPPPVLYYRGNLRLNDPSNALTVAMVGTRRPSTYGKRWTQRLSARATRQGAVIVSGLAAGIDTEAHSSCLQQRGSTVAVLGTGVDVVYPHWNQVLYDQIVTTGLVVSAYPDGTAPDRAHFPQRNRIIAGLSRAVLVMEAPARSGALITSRLANDYCREVYALPCGLDNSQGEGCLNLIDQGAQIILSEQSLMAALEAMPPVERLLPGWHEASSFRENNGLDQASAETTATPILPNPSFGDLPESTAKIPELSPLLRQVLDAVPGEPITLDQIVQLAQMDTGNVLGALVQLELLGLVTQLPGGMQYRRG